jgi:hypothetical protein
MYINVCQEKERSFVYFISFSFSSFHSLPPLYYHVDTQTLIKTKQEIIMINIDANK